MENIRTREKVLSKVVVVVLAITVVALTLAGCPVHVVGVSISPTTASILVPGTQQLIATIYPSDATKQGLAWSTSNPSVATVSPSGLVTGVASGNAMITVTTEDGDMTATCDVTVTEPVWVSGVEVTPPTASIFIGNTQQLTATVHPWNATNQAVMWSTTNSGIATVSGSGLVTGVAAGSATITVTTDDGGWTATCAVTVNLPYEALGGGATSTISIYNGKSIYTMITSQPGAKPESNSAPSTTYPYTLTTTAGSSSIIAPSMMMGMTESSVMRSTNSSSDEVYRSAQKNIDLFMREKENQVLGSRASQLMKKTTGIDAAPSSPIVVGTTWNNVYIVVTGYSINTTCRYISSHAYFFVDNRDTAAMSSYLANYGTAFDAIYAINHAKLGTENDVDSNGKVIIVFSEELTGGLLGYFYSVDKYSKATYGDSNEGDIFYMTTDSPYQGGVVNGTLAHEFQHMIYFDEHYDRGVTSTYSWLNEALSQAAEYYNNYTDNHLAWINNFLDNNWAGKSLTHWTSSNYGYGAIYIRYLIDRFGDSAIKNMCSTANVGVTAVESATGIDFNTTYNDFTRALVMSGTGDSSDPKYNFTTLNLQAVQPNGRGGLVTTSSSSAGSAVSGSLYPYRLFFASWTGSFGTMSLSGTDIAGSAFGLSQ